MEFGLGVDDVFMLVRWLAILMLGWVVRGWVSTPAANSFTSGAWLDILDAVVFSDWARSPFKLSAAPMCIPVTSGS